jgi:hypothetical protein
MTSRQSPKCDVVSQVGFRAMVRVGLWVCLVSRLRQGQCTRVKDFDPTSHLMYIFSLRFLSKRLEVTNNTTDRASTEPRDHMLQT